MVYYQQERVAGNTTEPVAIVGVGCKLPGNISTVEELLVALRDGRDCITEIPPERWDVDAYYDPDPMTLGKTYVRHGGFITDIDRFDAGFFGISDAEAPRMDPQQRILLQTVWHALENAGQSSEELLHSNTGMFLAMMNTNGYSQIKGHFEGLQGLTAYDAMSDAMSITAGRVSHFLGLEGPCFALDTACSGSLVALHLARQSILAGECDTAIVAGVSTILHPGIHITFSKVGLMSRAGRCAAFDARADGYIRGEGCVAVVLRRESLAIERGDHIFASIVGTAINQDGRTPALTAPNGRSQEKVIRMALARMGVSPHEIGYVEAHGTGTPVGDPIEMGAIVNVFGPGRLGEEPLFVGSVKSNFGHIEAGAGLLGLIKTALSLDQEVILPSLHFTHLNPNIDLGHAPIRVPTTAIPWPRSRQRRMAGVNSFGYSGTNAHAILQEAPLLVHDDAHGGNGKSLPERPYEMLVLSATSVGSLQELADKWIDFLVSVPSSGSRKDIDSRHPPGGKVDTPNPNESSGSALEQDASTKAGQTMPLRDIAFTAATGRTHLNHRLAVVGRTRNELSEKLRSWRQGRMVKGLAYRQVTRRRQKIAFVFTGQGAQYADMGRQLYKIEPRFAAAIDRCASFMDTEIGLPLHDILFGLSSAALLENTRYAQPALFAVEYALADLLRYWGVEPDYVIGHSVGEIVAACVAGVLSLEDAAKFVVARGRLMGQLPRDGKMLAVDATIEQAQGWIRGMEADVSIATVNGPHAIVISGKIAAVDAVARLALATGRRTRELDVSHAFHSPLMDPILKELTAVGASLSISPAKIPMASNVTGDFLNDDITAEYWSSHVRQPVLFYDGIRRIIEEGCSVMVEVGPHPTLTPAIATTFDMSKIRSIQTLTRDQQDNANIFETLASLYVNGVSLNLDRLFWSPLYRRVSLPLYPFRRDRHWVHADLTVDNAPEVKVDLHPLLSRAVNVGSRRIVFETSLSTTRPWTDHRVLGTTVFPGTAYLEMAARGFAAFTGEDWRPVVLQNVVFERPLLLIYGKPKKVSLTLENLAPKGEGQTTFVIATTGSGNPENYCRGRIAAASESGEKISVETELSRREAKLEIGPFYGELRKSGLEYGANFATVRELWQGKPNSGEAIGRVTISPVNQETDNHPFTNAVLLDGCLQVFGAALKTLSSNEHHGAFIPASIQSVTLRSQLPSQVWSHASARMSNDGQAALVHIHIWNDSGEVLAEIDGLELRQKTSFAPTPKGRETATSTTVPTGDQPAGSRFESRDQLINHLQKLPKSQRVQVLTKWLASEVKDIMGRAAEELDLDNIEPSTAFLEIGLDSLLVTELQRRIQEKLAFRFQPMQGLDYQSIESLAEYILDEVLVLGQNGDPTTGQRKTLVGKSDM